MNKNLFKGAHNFLSRHILDIYDNVKDRRICKVSLVKTIPSIFRDDENGVGFTGSQATRYLILEKIFKNYELKPDDSFVDIGCGKGRVLAYLVGKGYKNSLTGIEINEEAAKFASSFAQLYDNVNIIIGDAFEQSYNDYTVFFFGRPFLPKTFEQFITKLENELTHPITFMYWVDQQSGRLLKDRKGWTMLHREKIYMHGLLKLATTPQGFSLWTYNPNE